MRLLLLISAFLAFPILLAAQKPVNGAIRGNIFDKETAQPVGFATIRIDGVNLGSISDVNGFFSIPNVPVGSYKLSVSLTGYDLYETPVTVKKGEIVFQSIYIVESGQNLGEIVISGRKTQSKTEVQVSKISVTPKQIKSLPSVGGQSDIAQYLTVLPGVVFTGDQGGQLYIRGGSPVQNRILLDGMTIYNPFHSIGFFSVFETELIRNVDVLTGGFNAEHGGRISAIVDVKTREGNRKRLSGQFSGGPFQAKAILEGPIVPLKADNNSSISFVFAGKKAIIDQLDSKLYPKINDSTGIPFNYRDFYGKLSFLSGNGSKFNVFGFNYTDGVDYPATQFGWKSGGGGIDFTLVPTNSNTLINGTLTFSNYDSEIEEADRQPRTSGISGYYGALNFKNLGRDNEVEYGLALTGFRTEFQFLNFRGITIEQNDNTTEISGYVRWKRKIGPLVIEPGFRVQYYQSLDDVSPEPRLGLKYNISDKLRFKLAGGLYSQNLLSTVNERDIVNLFVGFLSGPEETVYQPNSTEPTKHRLQKALHGVTGVEIDVTDNFELNIEGYYKKFTQLLSLNRFKDEVNDPNYFVETGDAYGIDFSMKLEGKRSYLWGSYSLGYVTRNDGEQVYPPVFDRRHNLNLVGTYLLGKSRKWELGARWNFGSGFPFTLTQGFYTNYNFDDGVGTDVLTGNPDGLPGIVYASKRNGGRLPYYHRLDLSLKRVFKFTKYSSLEVTASATNVYDRPNIFYYDRVNAVRVNQLPFIPGLSLAFQF
ncbi:MAG: TonB-dependent receptor [Saprospiraceae bacterium]|nr:TonB-dependent receptor [Saprospiraceae bacterium]